MTVKRRLLNALLAVLILFPWLYGSPFTGHAAELYFTFNDSGEYAGLSYDSGGAARTSTIRAGDRISGAGGTARYQLEEGGECRSLPLEQEVPRVSQLFEDPQGYQDSLWKVVLIEVDEHYNPIVTLRAVPDASIEPGPPPSQPIRSRASSLPSAFSFWSGAVSQVYTQDGGTVVVLDARGQKTLPCDLFEAANHRQVTLFITNCSAYDYIIPPGAIIPEPGRILYDLNDLKPFGRANPIYQWK